MRPYIHPDFLLQTEAARRLYHNLGYQEVSILPCEFNGIPGVNLVCLEKLL